MYVRWAVKHESGNRGFGGPLGSYCRPPNCRDLNPTRRYVPQSLCGSVEGTVRIIRAPMPRRRNILLYSFPDTMKEVLWPEHRSLTTKLSLTLTPKHEPQRLFPATKQWHAPSSVKAGNQCLPTRTFVATAVMLSREAISASTTMVVALAFIMVSLRSASDGFIVAPLAMSTLLCPILPTLLVCEITAHDGHMMDTCTHT